MPGKMKNLILLTVVTLAFCSNLTAINQDSVTLSLRNKAFIKYHDVKDTVTVRTWMNMDRMNKALIQVVEYDNQLLESYKRNDSAKETVYRENTDTVIQKPSAKSNPTVQNARFQMKYLLATSVIVGVLLLILIVLLVKQTINYNKLRREYLDREDTFDSKLTRLEYLENEVLKMKSRENEVKTELEKGIIHYQEKMQQLRKHIDLLVDENTRLEGINSALIGGKAPKGETSVEKTEELKKEMIFESDNIIQRVKKPRK
jgi:hypothetical protein